MNEKDECSCSKLNDLTQNWMELNSIISDLADMYFLTQGMSRDGNFVFTKKYVKEQLIIRLERRAKIDEEMSKLE